MGSCQYISYQGDYNYMKLAYHKNYKRMDKKVFINDKMIGLCSSFQKMASKKILISNDKSVGGV